jgi:hypothetical protein
VLALAAIDTLAAIGFALIYAAGGSRLLTQGAFLVSLVVFFVSVTALWARIERSRAGLRDVITRGGRASFALIVVIVGLPALVLAPLLGLQEALPPTAGFADVVRPVLVLLLIALAWAVAVNVTGAIVVAGAALWAAVTRRPRPGP